MRTILFPLIAIILLMGPLPSQAKRPTIEQTIQYKSDFDFMTGKIRKQIRELSTLHRSLQGVAGAAKMQRLIEDTSFIARKELKAVYKESDLDSAKKLSRNLADMIREMKSREPLNTVMSMNTSTIETGF